MVEILQGKEGRARGLYGHNYPPPVPVVGMVDWHFFFFF
jgi:hypothetical protein